MNTTGNNWITIKILREVKSRLDIQKKSKSYSVYINDMVLYFDALNISPDSFSTHPSIEIKNDIERVIKIIRAIEKDKITPILNDVRKCEQLLNSQKLPPTPKDSNIDVIENLLAELNNSSDEVLTMDDLLNFISISKEREKEIIQLKEQSNNRPLSIMPPDKAYNSKLLLELLQEIESNGTSKDGKFIIDLNFFDAYIKRIKDELNK